MRSLCAATSFDKDTLVALGVIFTAVISLWNLGYNFQHNRRASYVTSVTATRLKWIGEIRDHLSRFVVLIYQATVAPPVDVAERQKIFAEIAHHRMLLRLQLAPDAAAMDKEFETKIESVFREFDSPDASRSRNALGSLGESGPGFLVEGMA